MLIIIMGEEEGQEVVLRLMVWTHGPPASSSSGALQLH